MRFPFRTDRSAKTSPAPSRRTAAHARPAAVVEALQDRVRVSFSGPVTSGGGGNSIAVGDFNRDGRDDVVVLSAKGSAVVSLSNGNGTFRQAATLTGAKGTPTSVSAQDYNGDGRLDVVVWGERESGTFTLYGDAYTTYDSYRNVWLGNGDGTFGRGSSTLVAEDTYGWGGVGNPTSAEADFNRDGVLDSARVGIGSGGVDVSLRNADGTYQAAQTYPAGSSPASVAVGDFDGDGWADIVVVNSLSSKQPTLSVLFNDGGW